MHGLKRNIEWLERTTDIQTSSLEKELKIDVKRANSVDLDSIKKIMFKLDINHTNLFIETKTN